MQSRREPEHRTQWARPSSEQKLRLCATVSRHPGRHTHREPLQIQSNQAYNVLHNQALKPLTNCPILKPPWLPWQHFYYVTWEQTLNSSCCFFAEGAHTSQKRDATKRIKARKHVAFNKSCFLIKPSHFHFCILKWTTSKVHANLISIEPGVVRTMFSTTRAKGKLVQNHPHSII